MALIYLRWGASRSRREVTLGQPSYGSSLFNELTSTRLRDFLAPSVIENDGHAQHS